MPQHALTSTQPRSSLDAAVEIAIEDHAGDARAALRTMVELVDHLTAQLEIARRAISRGYVRGERDRARP